ncbi:MULTISPECIES: phage portal protein [Delftia]|jgi:HK97 family phage portal protein|uniref:phage portal protein n=1 Tax=Delftia TaxID=80865 RepID=UPI00233EE776|nr:MULTISPECIES: phage portal protein [Delftia]MDC2858663.1 phage portal protein [Delftia sp. DT-2]
MFFSDVLASSADGTLVNSSGSFWQGLLGAAGSSSAGVRVTPESALALPILQNCVTLLAESLASCPAELYERTEDGGRKSATSHPAYDVLRFAPNEMQTPYDRIELSQMNAGLRGNSYSFIERRDDGNVMALWPLDTAKVTVLKGPDMLPYYRVAGIPDPLPMRLVHHVRWASLNGYTGLSPVQLHAESVGLAQAIRQYTGKSFANGATVSGVIERPKEAAAIKDQKSIDRIVDQWGNKFGGIDNAKKVALLQEGMTFKPVSMNNVDADVAAILKLSGVDVARIYKVPLPMVNDLEKANYNTIEQLLIQFVAFCLLAWAKRHEQAMTRDLILPQDRRRYYVEFNLSGLLRGDQKSRYEAYAIGRQWGWLSVNDIRRLENMPPVAGGDIYLQPLNMTAMGKGQPGALGAPGSEQEKATRIALESEMRNVEKALEQ